MKFRLEKKSTGRSLTTFHITDDKGTIFGSINVPNEQVSDLLKHWREPARAAATSAAKQTTAINAMVAAFKKGPRMSSKEAILRGC